MGLSAEIRQQLIQSFIVEQGEHVQNITQGLLTLEKDPASKERQAVLEEIFREAHSLKGSARAVGMTTIASLGHRVEELLLHAKDGQLDFSPELFDLLYQALDAVTLMMEQVKEGDEAPPTAVITLLTRLDEAVTQVKAELTETETETAVQPAEAPVAPVEEDEEEDEAEDEAPVETPAAAPTPSANNDETIRVSVNKLDGLMAQFSELLAAKIQVEQRLTEIRQLQELAAVWNKEWASIRNQYSRLLRNGDHGYGKDIHALIDFSSGNQERLRELMSQTNLLARQFANDNMHLKLIIDTFQEEIKRIRMLPLSTITLTFGRMVRDLAREQGKQIELHTEGEATELDKPVLEQVKDPLIHLLRNAVDHGIETPEARMAAGKSPTGHIILSASQQGSNIIIEVSDDGPGLDLESIRQAAIRKGLLTQLEADALSDSEAARLIFHSGLSTSRIITDISGRGVGLDVVRQNVEELHGILNVTFEPGQGTFFTMTLPLTLASSRGLLVEAGKQTFALPLSTVERMLQVSRKEIATVEGREAITYQGKPVMMAWLEDLLELSPTNRKRDSYTVVIVAVAEKRLGVIVDELKGEQEIVVKSLGKQLAKVGGLAGATLLGSGEVLLVLHTADLVKLAAHTHSHTPRATAVTQTQQDSQKTVLVVDDSITTRTLEKNILEAAGYRVRLATDGEEALGFLVSDNLPDLIVSDINMPRLDGFEMTNRVKHDNRYQNIPVILVTSLDSPADKARGIEVGADAYIVKSSFDQGNLLETIEQLI